MSQTQLMASLTSFLIPTSLRYPNLEFSVY